MGKPKNEPARRMENVLQTKLMPPRLQSSAIGRDELLQRLDQGLEKKLIVVNAPTGFGKTTLVSMWMRRRAKMSSDSKQGIRFLDIQV